MNNITLILQKNKIHIFIMSGLIVSTIIMSISGIFLTFHLFKSELEDLHIILGLAFMVFGFLHCLKYFKAIKKYSLKKTFSVLSKLSILSSVFLMVFGFYFSGMDSHDFSRKLYTNIANAPLKTSLKIMNVDYSTLRTKLNEQNIDISLVSSLKSLAKIENVETKDLMIEIANSQMQKTSKI